MIVVSFEPLQIRSGGHHLYRPKPWPHLRAHGVKAEARSRSSRALRTRPVPWDNRIVGVTEMGRRHVAAVPSHAGDHAGTSSGSGSGTRENERM
jgi:hypothetical protein